MEDLIFALSDFDRYTIVVATCGVVVAFWLIRETLDSFFLALAAAPILMIGALATNYIFKANFIMLVDDKDTNVVLASAVGVVTALALFMLSIWIGVLMSERRSQSRKLAELSGAPRDRK